MSVLLPAYNEELLLQSAIDQVVAWLREHRLAGEVLVLENGSRDQTLAIANKQATQHPEVRVLHLPEPNFGAAVRLGVTKARFTSTILLNVDWIETQFMTQALPLLQASQIVVGSKVLEPATDRRPLTRKLLSRLLTFVLHRFLGFTGSDSHGLKVFQTEAVRPIIAACQCFEIIETELLLRARRTGLSVVEIPVGVEELRAPRLSVARRCVTVARELWLLHQALRETKKQGAYQRESH